MGIWHEGQCGQHGPRVMAKGLQHTPGPAWGMAMDRLVPVSPESSDDTKGRTFSKPPTGTLTSARGDLCMAAPIEPCGRGTLSAPACASQPNWFPRGRPWLRGGQLCIDSVWVKDSVRPTSQGPVLGGTCSGNHQMQAEGLQCPPSPAKGRGHGPGATLVGWDGDTGLSLLGDGPYSSLRDRVVGLVIRDISFLGMQRPTEIHGCCLLLLLLLLLLLHTAFPVLAPGLLDGE